MPIKWGVSQYPMGLFMLASASKNALTATDA